MKEIFQTAVTFDLNEKKSYTTPNSTIIQLESELMLNPNSPGGSLENDPITGDQGEDDLPG